MADKVEKPKKQKPKPKQDEQGVLAALPSTRAQRIGSRRASDPAAAAQPEAVASSQAAKAARAKGSAAKTSTPKRAAKRSSTSRATAARRKAAAPRTFEPTPAAEAAAGAADERAAGAPLAAEPRPRPVREGAPGIGTTGERPDPTSSATRERAPEPAASEAESAERGRPSGVELVTTAVQAAGELTQIGLTVGGRLLKRAIDRLPKP